MENNNQTIIEDFKTYGVKQSGISVGSIESYKGFLDKFRSGNIIREGDLKKKTEEDKNAIQKQINNLETENSQLNGQINLLQDFNSPEKGQLPENLREIKKIENEIDEIIKGGVEIGKFKVFKSYMFVLYILFIIPLTTYLIFFYTAISHSALYGLDPTSMIQGNTISIPILPNFQDLMVALSKNYMLIFFPFVFFAFGVVESSPLNPRYSLSKVRSISSENRSINPHALLNDVPPLKTIEPE